MTRPDYVIVGPDPRRRDVRNPGGQLTATSGLLQYASEVGLELAFIDTLQGSFPVPLAAVRIAKVFRRQFQMLWFSTFRRPSRGVLIFAAGPGSFLERAITAAIARLFGINAIICLRSGHLSPHLGASTRMGKTISWLVRRQPDLLVQGQNWLPDLERAGVNTSRVHVVANWLAPDKPRASQPRRAREGQPVRFVYVGWLVAEKGLRELLDACESLVESDSAFHLTIIGGGTLHSEMVDRLAATGMANRVTMTGWVEPGDVPQHLEQSDVFVLPTYFEGFPNALIEAFALGLPAISTPVGAIPDSLFDGQNGFLVAPRDAQALAEAMARYIRHPQLIAKHSSAAIATIRQKHDFRTNCARLFETADGHKAQSD